MDDQLSPQASKSNHVLDLRSAAAAQPVKPARTPAKKAKPRTKAPAKRPTKTVAASAQAPLEEVLTKPVPTSKEFVDAALVTHGRFWPAFWRFLLLLLLLGLVLTGGLYLYLTYYAG